jgi:uncharacterized protein YggU (UPF0235/DUF167 family)
VTLHLRVTPNAGRSAVEGIMVLADGHSVLKLRVAAPPDKNRANAALMTLLAATLGVSPSAISITAGHTARLKTLRIGGDGALLDAALAALVQTSRDKTSH